MLFKWKPRVCRECDHLSTGHLDRRVNWKRCVWGRRLRAPENFVHEHLVGGGTVKVDAYGWADCGGSGAPMPDRNDCPDWKKKRFRLDLGNPEYA